MKRPILYVLVPFCLGVIFAQISKTPLIYAFLPAAVFLIAAGIFFKYKTISHTALFLAIFFTGSALFVNSNILPANHISNFIPSDERNNVFVRGTIIDDPVASMTLYKTVKTSFTLKAEAIRRGGLNLPYGWKDVSGLVKVDIFFKDYRPISFGDEVILEGTISKPHGLSNPGLFDYAGYLRLKNIYCCLSVNKDGVVEVLQSNGNGRAGLNLPYHIFDTVRSVAYKIRHRIRTLIDEYMAPEYGSFLKAVLIGDRTGIKDSIKDNFIKTGTVHVLVISGLHVGLIAAFFLSVFGIFRIPKKISLAITTVFLIFYSIIGGSNPPIIRAVVMFAIYTIGCTMDRDADSLNSLSAAALAILLWNPKELYDSGFQLSFISVGSILVFAPVLNSVIAAVKFKKYSWKPLVNSYRYITAGVSVSIAACLGSFPVIAAYFNIVSPVAIIANLIVIPILFLIVASSFLFFILSYILPWAAGGMAGFLQLTEKTLFSINAYLANIPFAYFRVGRPSLEFTFLYYALVALLIMPAAVEFTKIKITRTRIAIIMLLLCNILVWTPVASYGAQTFKMTMLDVGQGDSIFTEFPIRGNMLIDGGPGGEEDAVDTGESVVAPFLWNRGIGIIDIVLSTHFHEDHLGGLLYVLKNFKVGCVIDSGAIGAENGKIYEEYLKIIKSKNIRRISVGEGDMIKAFNDTQIFILNPPGDKILQDSNDNSIVMKLICGKESFLLCADIKDRAMSRLLTYEDFLKSDVIKIPHHGGAPGNNKVAADFFGFVAPDISLISVGAANKYGMPSGRTMNIINNLRSNVYMTKYSGAIEVYIDPKSNRLKKKTNN